MLGRDQAGPERSRMGARRRRASSTKATQPGAQTFPVALTIAGSDSSAGAGVQADLKTFSALGGYGLTAVSCIVAETPGTVSRLEPVSPELVRKKITLCRNITIAAAQTALL